MPVSELGSAFVTHFEPRRRAPDRRVSREPLAYRAPEEAAKATPVPGPAFFTPLVVPDLSQLTALDAAPPDKPAARADKTIYALLDRLVAAIRDGDLPHARALVETLETEMLVERIAGQASPVRPRGEAAGPSRDNAPVQAVEAIYETLAQYLATDGLAP